MWQFTCFCLFIFKLLFELEQQRKIEFSQNIYKCKKKYLYIAFNPWSDAQEYIY